MPYSLSGVVAPPSQSGGLSAAATHPTPVLGSGESGALDLMGTGRSDESFMPDSLLSEVSNLLLDIVTCCVVYTQ